jgi:hypothetical protein
MHEIKPVKDTTSISDKHLEWNKPEKHPVGVAT